MTQQEPHIPNDIAQIILDAFSIKTNLPIGLWQQGDYFALTASSEKKFEGMCQYLRECGLGEKCKEDHVKRAKEVKEFGETLCHLGLTNLAMPIYVDGQKVATLLYGQKKSFNHKGDKEADEKFYKNLPSLKLTKDQEKKVKKKYKNAKRFTEEIPELKNLERITQWIYQSIDEKIKLERETESLKREKELVNKRTEILQEEKTTCEMDTKRVTEEKEKIEEYIETVTHEIVISLQGSLADCENLLNYVIPDNEKVLKRETEDLLNSILRLRTTVFNIGNYLGGRYNFEKYDIRKVLNESKKTFESFANNREIEIRIHTSSKDPMIWISSLHVQHAINNLVHNAIKYSYSGSRLQDRKRFVEISGEKEDGYYKITIENFGIGIEEDEYDKIFEKGYKGRLTKDEFRTGAGYGLATVKEIVDMHDGIIEVESIKKHKTNDNLPYLNIFTIYLPIKKKEDQ